MTLTSGSRVKNKQCASMFTGRRKGGDKSTGKFLQRIYTSGRDLKINVSQKTP